MMAPQKDWATHVWSILRPQPLPSSENEVTGIGHLGKADPRAATAGALQLVASEADLLTQGLARFQLSSQETFLRTRQFWNKSWKTSRNDFTPVITSVTYHHKDANHFCWRIFEHCCQLKKPTSYLTSDLAHGKNISLRFPGAPAKGCTQWTTANFNLTLSISHFIYQIFYINAPRLWASARHLQRNLRSRPVGDLHIFDVIPDLLPDAYNLPAICLQLFPAKRRHSI